jgi:hypothetical protein
LIWQNSYLGHGLLNPKRVSISTNPFVWYLENVFTIVKIIYRKEIAASSRSLKRNNKR